MADVLLRDIGESEFSRRLGGEGISLRIGPFTAQLRVTVENLAEPLFRFYSSCPLVAADDVHSFRVAIEPTRAFPRKYRRLVRFKVDGQVPHEDLPFEQALPVLEWGINLVIAVRSHSYLMLHTAVVEKHGYALLMPAAPGFGKSTLCVALVHRGWRLLSDEFGLIRPGHQDFIPVPRPMALKNESIEIIRAYAPDAYIGPVIPNTRKGTVAHAAPPSDSVRNQAIGASARWVVFPRWVAAERLAIDRLPESDGLMKLAMNAFNYELLGEEGFQTAKGIIDNSECYRLVYSNLDEAVAVLDGLADHYASK
jgi:HprK-related kinase A